MARPKKGTQNDVANRNQQHLQVAASYSGPIPHPSDLAEYDRILPGAADRIIAMAERQASHRQQLETVVVKSGARDSLCGLIFGLIIGITGIVAGAIIIAKGYQVAGSFLGTGSIASLVGVFVYGSRQRRKEREAKNRALNQ